MGKSNIRLMFFPGGHHDPAHLRDGQPTGRLQALCSNDTYGIDDRPR